MLSTTAIVSLACLLSTGEADSTKLVEGLSAQDAAKVQEVIDSGACGQLPEAFSKLVNKQAGFSLKSNPTELSIERAGPPTSDFAK